MELAKRLREFWKLMIRIEATGIWKNPELRWAQGLGLGPKNRVRLCKRNSICTYTNDRNPARLIAARLSLESPRTRKQFRAI